MRIALRLSFIMGPRWKRTWRTGSSQARLGMGGYSNNTGNCSAGIGTSLGLYGLDKNCNCQSYLQRFQHGGGHTAFGVSLS